MKVNVEDINFFIKDENVDVEFLSMYKFNNIELQETNEIKLDYLNHNIRNISSLSLAKQS